MIPPVVRDVIIPVVLVALIFVVAFSHARRDGLAASPAPPSAANSRLETSDMIAQPFPPSRAVLGFQAGVQG